MEDLGLNEQHHNIVVSYMQFAKYQRTRNAKFIEMSFQDIIDARLNEATYTKDEVKELLEELQTLVKGEVEGDLIEISHTNVLLFTQLLTQAEKWHLRMTVDLSEIQNRELLDKVKILEENEGKAQPERKKLQPLTESTGTLELLRIEIDRLRKENDRLESQLQTTESKLKEIENENIQLEGRIQGNEAEISQLKQRTEELTISKDTNNTEQNKKDSEELLGEYEKVLRDQLSLELDSMRQEMLAVQSQLSLAEQELERKFNQTAAFANMKAMINKKNEQVKELRIQLQKYHPEDDVSEQKE